ncbi:putative guanine nucleotide exchange factor [Helianthus anomalus]
MFLIVIIRGCCFTDISIELSWLNCNNKKEGVSWCEYEGAIKEYLCLSLLKNGTSTLVIVCQPSRSIFISLLSRFGVALKTKIGVFFPLIVQPNFSKI